MNTKFSIILNAHTQTAAHDIFGFQEAIAEVERLEAGKTHRPESMWDIGEQDSIYAIFGTFTTSALFCVDLPYKWTEQPRHVKTFGSNSPDEWRILNCEIHRLLNPILTSFQAKQNTNSTTSSESRYIAYE